MTLTHYSLQQAISDDLSQDVFPARVSTWHERALDLPDSGTHFGFVAQGRASLWRQEYSTEYGLVAGMYFCLPRGGYLDGTQSTGIVITCLNYRGMFSLGGPIESRGRLAYIDGGMSTVLIPPMQRGEPCLNAMYFPSGVEQTLHSHPSYRVGLAIAGTCEIITPTTIIDIEPNTVFVIPAHSLHRFRTYDQNLTIVVFHPSSSIGLTHQQNPMLEQTIVDGVSAAQRPDIQTRMVDG